MSLLPRRNPKSMVNWDYQLDPPNPPELICTECALSSEDCVCGTEDHWMDVVEYHKGRAADALLDRHLESKKGDSYHE